MIVGVKVQVREGESLEQAFRRLRQLIFKENRWPLYKSKPTKRRQTYYQKPCELRRQRESLAKTRQRQNLNYILNQFASRWQERHPRA